MKNVVLPSGKHAVGHNHFRDIYQILQFLFDNDIIVRMIDSDSNFDLIRETIQFAIQYYVSQLPVYIKQSDQKQVKQLFGSLSLEHIFTDYISSRVQKVLFPLNYYSKDKGFRMNCQIHNFLVLADIFPHKHAALIQDHLKVVVRTLQRITKAAKFMEKFEILKESLDKIVEIVSSLTDKVIGSEELNPILTYCLLKANPFSWISNVAFMKLMISDKDKKGEKGFALTKIEISTNIIENANQKFFECQDFSEKVL